MARPKFDVTKLPPRHKGALEKLRYGHITLAEAAALLQAHRMTIARWCALLGIDPVSTRRAYLRRCSNQLDGIGRRPSTKATLRKRAAKAVSDFRVRPLDTDTNA